MVYREKRYEPFLNDNLVICWGKKRSATGFYWLDISTILGAWRKGNFEENNKNKQQWFPSKKWKEYSKHCVK